LKDAKPSELSKYSNANLLHTPIGQLNQPTQQAAINMNTNTIPLIFISIIIIIILHKLTNKRQHNFQFNPNDNLPIKEWYTTKIYDIINSSTFTDLSQDIKNSLDLILDKINTCAYIDNSLAQEIEDALIYATEMIEITSERIEHNKKVQEEYLKKQQAIREAHDNDLREIEKERRIKEKKQKLIQEEKERKKEAERLIREKEEAKRREAERLRKKEEEEKREAERARREEEKEKQKEKEEHRKDESSRDKCNENSEDSRHKNNEFDPYQILGISKDASQDEIKNTYLTLIKQYHPDKVENFGPEIKKVAIEMTKKINAAYTAITK